MRFTGCPDSWDSNSGPTIISCRSTRPSTPPALEFADAHGLLVLVHTFGESPFDAPALLAEAAAKYPRARFLMGHSGYGEWETSVAIARDYPNVYLDLTSVVQALDFSQMPGGSLMPRVPAISPHVNGLIEYMVGDGRLAKDRLRQRPALVQPALPRGGRPLLADFRRSPARHPAPQRRTPAGRPSAIGLVTAASQFGPVVMPQPPLNRLFDHRAQVVKQLLEGVLLRRLRRVVRFPVLPIGLVRDGLRHGDGLRDLLR